MKGLRWVGIIWCVIFGANVFGQSISPHIPPYEDHFPFFSLTWVKENRIKEIRTEVMYKAKMQPIVNSIETDFYRFNSLGNIEEKSSINSAGVKSSSKYFYSTTGQLSSEQVVGGVVDHLLHYEYNADGFVSVIKTRDLSGENSTYTEEFTYEKLSDSQYKKYWLNSEGLTYRYAVIDQNESGQITEERIRYIRGASRETRTYVYKEDKLVSFVENIRTSYRREVKFDLVYNDEGRLEEINKYVDGAFVTHIEYLYKGNLISAILTKDIKSQKIKIEKFLYTFYS